MLHWNLTLNPSSISVEFEEVEIWERACQFQSDAIEKLKKILFILTRFSQMLQLEPNPKP
jgi:hypothetical protein